MRKYNRIEALEIALGRVNAVLLRRRLEPSEATRYRRVVDE